MPSCNGPLLLDYCCQCCQWGGRGRQVFANRVEIVSSFAGKTILLLLTAMLVLAGVVSAEQRTYLVVSENQQWQGEIVLTQPILVAAGVELIIAPGTRISAATTDSFIRVEGSLQAIGSAAQPIKFVTPPGWQGIELFQSAVINRFAYVYFDAAETALSTSLSRFEMEKSRFRNCTTAIKLLRQSMPTINSSDFSDNKIAIDIGMRSQVSLSGNRFIANGTAIMASHNSAGDIKRNDFIDNTQAIYLQHLFPGHLSKNTFTGNKTGILCDQTMASPVISANKFAANEQGIVCLLASRPQIEGNVFRKNRLALFNNQLGSPRVENNLFDHNVVAVKSERRSAPMLARNHFENNQLALFCDYLSYPTVKQNNFIANDLSVKLGDHQSADMDDQGASAEQKQKFLADSGRSGKQAVFPAASGVVDVSDNWWGKELEVENPQFFYARQQDKWVLDESTGVRYLRDQIDFSPWLRQPVAEAGVK